MPSGKPSFLRLRLTTKFTVVTALLVLAAAAAISLAYIAQITRIAVQNTEHDDMVAANQVLLQAQGAVTDAATAGHAPASGSPEDVREFLQTSLEQSQGLSSGIDAVLANYPAVYEVSITDNSGSAMVSSDPALLNHALALRSPFSDLTRSSALNQLRVVFGATQLYEVRVPFAIRTGDHTTPYGEVRVTVETGLLRSEVTPGLRAAAVLALLAVLLSTVLASIVSRVFLSPLEAINRQLDRYSAGQFESADAAAREATEADAGELGQVSSKITRLGEQLRGVREIFSTLRENLNQVMGGLDDGLILFTQEGRAVLVSPAVEKFLGAPANQFLGRPASEIFPPAHPLRTVLHFEKDHLLPVENADLDLIEPYAPGGPRRFSISVQPVQENGSESASDWGSLVTLRDLESRERIGSELELSERMSALARITQGVAHEVKNPLNSMRLWLETLKETLPSDHDESAHAVRVLDKEIDRLDHVVKRFLDFTRPVEMHVEDISLAEVLSGVVELARPQIDRAGVSVEMKLASELPMARGDKELLRQAFLNLVFNAIEAMNGPGRLTVSLKRREDDARIEIADTGPGIPPEYRSRIFQLFFTTRKAGSGLGLATTFRIVQLHNGSIDFQSEVGRGTTFRVDLPLPRTQIAPVQRTLETASEPATAT